MTGSVPHPAGSGGDRPTGARRLRVTFGIPTYNRARYLDKTLASLARLRPAEGVEYDILVINNNCTDATDEVVDRHREVLGSRLNGLAENRPGVCHGRNRIVAESPADVVAFFDDDVEVDPGWLEALAGAWRRWPGAAAIGGKSYLIFEMARPAWIGDWEARKLSEIDLGDKPLRLTPNQTLFGLNLSVNRSVVEHLGGFRTDLDRVGNILRGGGETELLDRMQKDGDAVYYDPAMIVGHYVPPERCRKRWFLRRAYWGARSSILLHRAEGVPIRFSIRVLLARLARSGLAAGYHAARYGRTSPAAYEHAKAAAIAWGRLRQMAARVPRGKAPGGIPVSAQGDL